jgi:hypothetical protein
VATYAPQKPTSKGTTLTMNSSANGDKVPPGSTLIVQNTSGSNQTVTLVAALTLDGDLTVANRTSDPIANNAIAAVDVPNTEVYRNPADGLVTVNFSAPGATLKYAVIS